MAKQIGLAWIDPLGVKLIKKDYYKTLWDNGVPTEYYRVIAQVGSAIKVMHMDIEGVEEADKLVAHYSNIIAKEQGLPHTSDEDEGSDLI